MSKRTKKGAMPSVSTCDRHHLLFQKRYWSKGYAKALCQAFVRYVPIAYHRELHANLPYVPVPPPELLRNAWLAYQADKDAIDKYDVCRAAAWLYVHIPDAEFRRALQYEVDFFTTRLKSGD